MIPSCSFSALSPTRVTRGLDPRVHLFAEGFRKRMDCRVKPGNDKSEQMRPKQNFRANWSSVHGIEPATCALQKRCSTAELTEHGAGRRT